MSAVLSSLSSSRAGQGALHRAERADSQGEMDPAKLPEQIGKRQALKAKLEAARHQLEARHRQGCGRSCRSMKKKKRGGKRISVVVMNPKPPVSGGPDPGDQSNLSDPDSRIMRKSKNEAFAQAYNAQLAVDGNEVS